MAPVGPDKAGYSELELGEPAEVRSISVLSQPVPGLSGPAAFATGQALVLEASEDGREFRKLWDIPFEGSLLSALFGPLPVPATGSFVAVGAKHFRIVARQPRLIRDVRFSGAVRIPNWRSKTNFVGPGLGS